VKCPQGLEIPDLLEKVVAELEDDQMAEREVRVRRFFTGMPPVREAPDTGGKTAGAT
jgi:hypothetical protein